MEIEGRCNLIYICFFIIIFYLKTRETVKTTAHFNVVLMRPELYASKSGKGNQITTICINSSILIHYKLNMILNFITTARYNRTFNLIIFNSYKYDILLAIIS